MSYTYRLIILFAILIAHSTVNGQSVNQNVKDVVMPAPNAAALGKYGDIPVSYYTGVPNISVPITTVQEGPLTLPISLSYHASGIKVGEMASWVGMGWSLNAAGMITRTIQGLPDEVSPAGYYHSGSSLATGGGVVSQTTLTELASGFRDGEPDLFSFTAGDLTGKFYIDKDKIIRLVPRQDLRIELIGGASFSGFIITKPDGTRYYFGNIPGNSTVVQEETTMTSEGVPRISSWFLMRIETADKLYSIDFTYTYERYAYKSLASCKKQVTSCSTGNGWSGGGAYICSTDVGYDEAHRYLTAAVVSQRLSQITVGSGTSTVVFGADTPRTDLDAHNAGGTAYRLDFIEVNSGASKAYCTRFDLSYDVFQDGSSSSITARSESRRLKLTQIQEKACSGEAQYTKPPTKFTYNGSLSSNGKQFLPHRLSKAIDHWGFYNAKDQNNSERINVPTTTISVPGAGSTTYTSNVNRSVDETAMKLGVLEKIDYPTGGSTIFTYEANTYNGLKPGTNIYKKLNGNLEPIQTAVTPYESRNCTDTTIYSVSPHVTFNSDTEVAAASFKLYLTSAYQTKCEFATDKIVKVSIIEVSTNKQVGVTYSFDANDFLPGRTDGNVTKRVTEIYPGLRRSVAYKFVLNSRNAMGKLEVFTTTAPTPTILKTSGLRIQSIRTTDGISEDNDVIKSYSYHTSSTASTGRLLYSPRYGYFTHGVVLVVDQAPYNYGGEIDAVFFDENSLMPLTSFEGYHIGYSSVKEIYNGSGYTLYRYNNPDDPIGNNTLTYPRPPHQIDVSRGTLSQQISYVQSRSTAVSSTSYMSGPSNYTSSPGTIIRLSAGFPCVSAFSSPGGPINNSSAYFHTPYIIRSGAYQLSSKTETIDGVSTQTSYTYDEVSLAPKTVSVTNSDGKVTKTTYSYPYDLSSGALRTAMVTDRYMIGIPIETKIEVDNLLTGGSKIEYSLFDRITGLPVSSGTKVDPYPHKFYNYEMTWNGSTATTAAAVLKGTINSYHPANSTIGKGYPKQYTATNWPAESYEWKNGLIAKRTYSNYVWKYTYESNTRLLSSITDIDGQVTNFTYDKLQRLKTTSARGGDVKTTYDYHYTAGALATDKNYVKSTTTYTAATGSGLKQQISWQYLDGLGRLLQTVDEKHSPGGKDVVTAVAYDNQGRQVKAYNPFESSASSGAFTAIPTTAKFTLTGYEASPLNRVNSVTPPDWYATTTTYGANDEADAVYKNGSTKTKYDAGQLYRVTVKDPMGNYSITFTDKKGRVILSRRTPSTSTTEGADTYSIYDDKDRLTTVIPPGAKLSSNGLIFSYTYDAANNLLTKKVPDAATVTYKYNTRDQPTLMQDGNLAADGRWLATLYDEYGRPTLTGFWTGKVPATISPTDLTVKDSDRLTRTLYDGVDDDKDVDNINLASNPQYRGKVRQAYTRVLDGAATPNWLVTINTYDPAGRLTATTGNSYQNLAARSGKTAAEQLSFTYDGADNLLTQTRVHRPSGSVTRTLTYRNTYDHAGRRSAYFVKVDDAEEVLLADYYYNERDLLAGRSLGGRPISFTPSPPVPRVATGAASEQTTQEAQLLGPVMINPGPGHTYLQNLNYTYNAQGWLTTINQSDLGGTSAAIALAPTTPTMPDPGAVPRSNANDLFYLELRYDQLLSGVDGTGQKDGNIAQVIWRTRGRERQAYSATYDYLSRMKVASYYDLTDAGAASSDQKFREEVTYADLRGNIKTLQRNGLYADGAAWKVGQIDKLTYTTTSGTNKLASVSDAASTAAAKSLGFNPGAGGTGYTYDANGNLQTDSYKGITAITYNHLNLPDKIAFGKSKSITLVYDAAGRKLKKVTGGGAGAENYTQYYADGLEYRGSALEAIYHEEGRITPKSGGGWQYEYSIRDHLGNTRLTFADKDGDGKISLTNTSANEVLQENHYTPFGLELGYAWMNEAGAVDTRYRFNGIERTEDFGAKLDMADFRSYDAAIGRWLQVDPMAAVAPHMNSYRFGFNNPLGYRDPLGLFETRDEARQYRKDNDLEGRIRKQEDGRFGIVNRKEHSITIKDGEYGVITASYVQAKRTDQWANTNGPGGSKAITIEELTYRAEQRSLGNEQNIDWANNHIVRPLPTGSAGLLEYVGPSGPLTAASMIYRVPAGERWVNLSTKASLVGGQFASRNATYLKFTNALKRLGEGSSKTTTYTGKANQYGNDVKDYLDNCARVAKDIADGGIPGG